MDQSQEYIASHRHGLGGGADGGHDEVYNSHPDATTKTNAADNAMATIDDARQPASFFLDNIIVGYAFGSKKMETMGLIMAEASKASSSFECAGGALSALIDQQQRQRQPANNPQNQKQYLQNHGSDSTEMFDESSMAATSMATMTTAAEESSVMNANEERVEKGDSTAAMTRNNAHYFSDNDDEDTRSFCSSKTRSSYISGRSSQRGGGSSFGGYNSSNGGNNGIQLTFLPDSSGFIHLVRTSSAAGGEGESMAGSSVTTSATNFTSSRKHQGGMAATSSGTSCASPMRSSLASSLSKEMKESSMQCGRSWSSRHSNSTVGNNSVQRHPIRVSFVPIDLDTPLEEQHGGKFDVILHKMTEDILCMSKMLRARGVSGNGGDLEQVQEGGSDQMEIGAEQEGQQAPSSASVMATQPTNAELGEEDPNLLFESTPSMNHHQARASQRIQRLREYKQIAHPSCVLVDSPNNILAVMSRADMAEVLSRCLVGVTTRGGIPVRTPRFRVVEDVEDTNNNNLEADNNQQSINMQQQCQSQRATTSLADEIDNSGFAYPLIAKPLTAAGTKSSHHMGIVLARDGLQRLKTPCLLQEYANHGEMLFKVYVLGGSVWVFSRESLPNLPLGENNNRQVMDNNDEDDNEADDEILSPRKRPRTESYVEFERPAGSRCYVEFNSQRPYPKLSDFGILSEAKKQSSSFNNSMYDKGMPEQQCRDASKLTEMQRTDHGEGSTTLESFPSDEKKHQRSPPSPIRFNLDKKNNNSKNTDDLARFVTKEEIEPVTNALRQAFGLELFGFDVLVKHQHQGNERDKNHDGDAEKKEILVVDVNYFPGYKEVPNFPSLLAQYLTQKAVESRLRNFDNGS